MEYQLLKNLIDREAEKVGFILENAIEEGAKVIIKPSLITINDTINVFKNLYSEDNTMSVVLRFTNETVAKAFEPSKDDLAKLAEQKRMELAEIEQQIKEKEAKDETDRN